MTCDRSLLCCSLKLDVQRVAHTRPAEFRCAFSVLRTSSAFPALTRTVMQHRIVRYALEKSIVVDRSTRSIRREREERKRKRETERGMHTGFAGYSSSMTHRMTFCPLFSHRFVRSRVQFLLAWHCTLSLSLFGPGGSRWR